jgi:hypothetical protein
VKPVSAKRTGPTGPRARFSRVQTALILAVVASCGGSSGINAGNASNMIAQAVCTSGERCCSNPSGNYLSQCELDSSILMSPATESPGTTHPNFNQDTADACLEAAQGFDCDSSLPDIDQLCQMVFTGDVALGQPCTINADCAQSPSSHALCLSGACTQTSLYGREGDTCDWQVMDADRFVCRFYEGLTCVQTPGTTMGTCIKYAALGAACPSGVRCVSGTYCDSTGTCQQPGKAGDSCGGAADPPCGNALVCTSTGTCGQNACG